VHVRVPAEPRIDRQTAAPASPERDNPGVLAPPPLIYLAGLVIGFAVQAALPRTSVAAAVRWPVGIVLIVIGGGLARAFFTAFARADTPVSPYGTPRALVTDGPYRISRNPGYLGMALAFAGIAVLAEALWTLAFLAVVLAVVDRGVIAREQRYLERAFGEEYRRYKRQTRRWL
jgi:protein-S-isoprenylcysteine O-methyltransferase Ste14